MFFGIVQIKLDSETTNEQSYGHAVNVCERLRSRMKVIAKPYEYNSDESNLSIVVALLEESEEKLNQKIDSIMDTIETSGLGRVFEHHLLSDDVDSIEA